MKHCYIHVEDCIIAVLFIKNLWPCPQVYKLDGCQNARMRAAANISIENNVKASASKAR